MRRLDAEDLLQHLTKKIKNNFGYEDDYVIEKLRSTMEELTKRQLNNGGQPPVEELPKFAFGLVPSSRISFVKSTE